MLDRHLFLFLEIFSREGGIQSYVKDILQAYLSLIPTENYRGEIFLLRDGADCHNPFDRGLLNFRYFKTPAPWQGRLKFTAAFLLYLLQNRPTHVYCGHINLISLVRIFCQPLGIPYTILTYGKEVWERLPEGHRKALQQAEAIWTISRYSRDRLCQSNDISLDRVKIVPCVVDGSVFTPATKNPALLDKYHLTGAKILMTVARLWSGDPYKGVDVTIRALPEIISIFPEVKYLVIGRGDDQPRLARLATELGVADRVVFAGFVPTEALPDHYRLADAYIMPSQEGFGIVYLEAMACGKPVLAGDADGAADPLQDGQLGWCVPHRNPQAVAHACLAILRGEDQRCDDRWLREQSLAKFGKETLTERLKILLKGEAVDRAKLLN
jgi:phosphatidyl-myo-inositol dimannoside synthase